MRAALCCFALLLTGGCGLQTSGVAGNPDGEPRDGTGDGGGDVLRPDDGARDGDTDDGTRPDEDGADADRDDGAAPDSEGGPDGDHDVVAEDVADPGVEDTAADDTVGPDVSTDDGGGHETVRVECESGVPYGMMTILYDPAAFGELAVYTPAGAGTAAWDPAPPFNRVEIPVYLSRGGTYRAWVRVLTRSGAEDAQFFAFDGVGPQRFYHVDWGTYRWVGAEAGGVGAPLEFTTTPGLHMVFVAAGEPEVRCDRVLITTDTAFVPTETP
jgi:hypothetical protein